MQHTIGEAAFYVNKLAREEGLGSAGVCQICYTRASDWSLVCGHRGCRECFTQLKDIAVHKGEEWASLYQQEPAPRMQCPTCRVEHPISRSVLVNGEPGEWQLCGHASY